MMSNGLIKDSLDERVQRDDPTATDFLLVRWIELVMRCIKRFIAFTSMDFERWLPNDLRCQVRASGFR
jgi:hypothetical protein